MLRHHDGIPLEQLLLRGPLDTRQLSRSTMARLVKFTWAEMLDKRRCQITETGRSVVGEYIRQRDTARARAALRLQTRSRCWPGGPPSRATGEKMEE